ncbi:uncharacterized protein EI97DRAFT_374776 [Westerdykella ornata]|uniref:Uncharacterized protein n=1 Tax=Westerdykella ornata TaxID=318751 RepID=A0A6A6JLS8_WESOR|nr:uncharacterized protein EI97DRAFT_374776 [Westerdykella ornata]KAF2277457.1 hypothetical protein EI97DRAFT_374776 [Westerdykella ornata]
MAVSRQCPIPEIDQVLSAYVRPTHEITRIRKALSDHLLSNIKSEKAALHHVDLACPQDDCSVNARAALLKGARLRYLQAVDAQRKAEARHQELKASLDRLRKEHIEDSPVADEAAFDREATASYLSLLRQRRRLAELQVIQNSLEKLVNIVPIQGSKDLKALVTEIVGEQPDIPAERLDQITINPDNEVSIFKLKKEVLEAKTSMDQAKSAKSSAKPQDSQNSSLAQQVYALSCARDQLVEWIEGELGKLNEESDFLEDASPVKRTSVMPEQVDIHAARSRIEDTYNAYTASRSHIIVTHGKLDAKDATLNGIPVSHSEADRSGPSPVGTPDPSVIGLTFPYLLPIAQAASNERSLLQQTVYLQGRLTAADQELSESLIRLSDESHLVSSGPSVPAAWAKAASDALTATRDFVEEQLLESQSDIEKVTAIFHLSSLQHKVLDSV